MNKVPANEEALSDFLKDLRIKDTQQILDKALKRNDDIEQAQKMLRMFNTEEFKIFWKALVEDFKPIVEKSPLSIQGNPFEKLEQLGYMQGGMQMLESQEAVKDRYLQVAKLAKIPVEELEQKLKTFN